MALNLGFSGKTGLQVLEKVKASGLYFWVFIPGINATDANRRGLQADDGTVKMATGYTHIGVWIGANPLEDEFEVVTKVKARTLEEAKAKVSVR